MTALRVFRAPLFVVLSSLRRLTRLWDEAESEAEVHYRGASELVRGLERLGIRDLTGLRLLEIGCGDRGELSLMFSGLGSDVDAVDLIPVRFRWRPLMWLKLARSSGLRAAARQLLRDCLHTWRYWRGLQRLARKKLPFDRVRVHEMNAEELRFPDDTFDLVVSSAVWEHIKNSRWRRKRPLAS